MGAELDGAIAAAHDRARRAWPDVGAIAADRFAAELHRRLGPDLTVAELAELCTDDVYLAIACLAGDPRAGEHLERCLDEVGHAARKLRATDEQAAEMRGHLRSVLFTVDADRRAGLDTYTGRGNLRGYIKVIATRELIRVINRGRKEQPIEPLLERLELERAPELSMLRAQHGTAIAQALRTALAALPDRDRALLRYSLVDAWSVAQIGELYGVHKATAARWVAAARDALGDRLRSEVAAQVGITPGEVDSLIALVRSRIDVSLERIL